MKTVLERKLRAQLQRLSIANDALLVAGVSGGADSIALADALTKEHTGEVVVAHLNHLLRGSESDDDEAFVRDFASNRNLKVIVERHNIEGEAQIEGRNLEAVARDRRYDFLAGAAHSSQSNIVLTAHTRDDQVETILMRLLRGTGPEGLRGIHVKRALDQSVLLIRPMLDVTRAEVLAHCERYRLSYRTDSSNLSIEIVRNRVRRELLPQLRSFNPRLDEAVLRTASIIVEDDELLNTQAERLLLAASDGQHRLSFEGLTHLHPALRRRVLRLWLRRARGDLRRIDRIHLAAVEKLMLEGEGAARIELPGGFVVNRKQSTLLLGRVIRPGDAS